MRGRTLLFSYAFLVRVAAGQPPDSVINFGQRFLLINTLRENTLKGELNRAGAAGYRVVAGVGMRHLVLEKVASPEVYRYQFAANRQEVMRAGAVGYRLHPLVKSWLGQKEGEYDQAFLMELRPGLTETWTYSEVRVSPLSRLVRLTVGRTYFYGHVQDTLAIFETPGELAPSNGPPYSDDSLRVLKADKLSELEDRVREVAAQGYRVIAASDQSLAVICEKSGHRDPVEHHLARAKRAATMQKQLNNAAHQGFRLVPEAIGTYRKELLGMFEGLQTETFAFLIRNAGTQAYEYLLVTSQNELNKAASQGYSAVAMKDFDTHNAVVFLERIVVP